MRQLDLFTDCQPFAVVAVGHWEFGGGIQRDQKQCGQVTKCRTPGGLVFYVRENLNGTWSFHISSAERWREKGGNYGGRGDRQKKPQGPSDWRQCLDLACPPEYFAAVRELVRAADPLERLIRRHRCFTAAWAERILFESNRP